MTNQANWYIKKAQQNNCRALDLRPKDKQSALPQVITPKLLHLAVNRLHLNQIFLVLKTRLTLYLHQIAGLNIQ